MRTQVRESRKVVRVRRWSAVIGVAAVVATMTVAAPPVQAAGFPSDDCNSGGSVSNGWLGSVYHAVRTASIGSTTLVCVVFEQAPVHIGGRLTISTAAPVTPSTDTNQAACADPLNAGDYTLIRDIGVLGRQVKIDMKVRPSTSSPSEAWVCIRVDNVTARVIVPAAIVQPPAFAADDTSVHVPQYPANAQTAGSASATCKQSGGETGRLANLATGGVPTYVYTWQETATRQHLCVRTGAGPGDGGRLTIDRNGGLTVATTDASTDKTPCAQQIYEDAGPPPSYLYVGDPGVGPAWACLRLGTTYLRVKLDSAGGQNVVTFTRDS